MTDFVSYLVCMLQNQKTSYVFHLFFQSKEFFSKNVLVLVSYCRIEVVLIQHENRKSSQISMFVINN